MLVFDVELIDLHVAPKVEVPADVAAPPADAKEWDGRPGKLGYLER